MADEPKVSPEFAKLLLQAYTIAKRLPDDQRNQLLSDFYQQKLANHPEFLQLYPTMQDRAGAYQGFTGSAGKREEMLYAPEPEPGMARRVLGEYQNPMTARPHPIVEQLTGQDTMASRVLGNVGNVFNFLGTPGRAAKEGVDAGLSAAGVRQPGKGGTATGPGQYLPDTLGGWAQLPVDWLANPLMLRILGAPRQAFGAARRWGQGIEEGRRAAQAENLMWDAGFRGPRALPGAGQTGGAWPMPSGNVPYRAPDAIIPPHAPRPQELMPRPRMPEGQMPGGAPYLGQ